MSRKQPNKYPYKQGDVVYRPPPPPTPPKPDWNTHDCSQKDSTLHLGRGKTQDNAATGFTMPEKPSTKYISDHGDGTKIKQTEVVKCQIKNQHFWWDW